MDKIIAYTDGSAIDNGSSDSKCGWACKLIYKGKSIVKSGKAHGKTNNQMEMYAVYQAMRSIHDKTIPVEIISDSQYVIKTLNKQFNVGANADMWEYLFKEAEKFSDITFSWIKGHAGDQNNEEVDELSFKEASEC